MVIIGIYILDCNNCRIHNTLELILEKVLVFLYMRLLKFCAHCSKVYLKISESNIIKIKLKL